MGLKSLNLATLNSRGLRDPSKCARMLAELLNLNMKVAEVQWTVGSWRTDFAVFSAYGSRNSVGVSLLVGRSLDADGDVGFAGDGSRLIVADVAIKSFKFRVSLFMRPISLVIAYSLPE